MRYEYHSTPLLLPHSAGIPDTRRQGILAAKAVGPEEGALFMGSALLERWLVADKLTMALFVHCVKGKAVAVAATSSDDTLGGEKSGEAGNQTLNGGRGDATAPRHRACGAPVGLGRRRVRGAMAEGRPQPEVKTSCNRTEGVHAPHRGESSVRGDPFGRIEISTSATRPRWLPMHLQRA